MTRAGDELPHLGFSSAEAPVVVDLHPLGGEAASDASAAVVRLNRPGQLNPIDAAMLEALDDALDAVAARRQVRAVLITGNGRAFSAGGDLKKYIALQRDPVAFPRFVAELHRVFGRLRRLTMPAVALVNGVTAAGGLELMLNCDFAIVAASARIGDGHLNFGQMGGGGVLTLLPRLIGRARAAELLFSGRFLSAEEAVQWGLASRRVPDDELLSAGLGFAREVADEEPAGGRQCQAGHEPAVGRQRQRGSRPRLRARAGRLLLPHVPRRPRGPGRLRREAPPSLRRAVTTPQPEPGARAEPGPQAGVRAHPEPEAGPEPEPDEHSAAFWAGLRRHRIVLQSCERCGRRRFPPMPSCPFCGARGGVEVEVAGTGTVYSWVGVHRPLTPAFAGDVPYSVAAVDLDGGGRVFARIEPPADAAIGLRVSPLFVDHGRWTELRFGRAADIGDPGNAGSPAGPAAPG